ncbi:MAG: hypothetical protein M3M88_04155 [Thermoproteota archaeon]|nr:hypothetical protein [Thermoproteota archaeon]
MNGWLGIVGGIALLGYVETIIKDFRNEAIKANKNADSFGIILLAYPDLRKFLYRFWQQYR